VFIDAQRVGSLLMTSTTKNKAFVG